MASSVNGSFSAQRGDYVLEETREGKDFEDSGLRIGEVAVKVVRTAVVVALVAAIPLTIIAATVALISTLSHIIVPVAVFLGLALAAVVSLVAVVCLIAFVEAMVAAAVAIAPAIPYLLCFVAAPMVLVAAEGVIKLATSPYEFIKETYQSL